MDSLALLGISLNPLSYLSTFIKDLFSAALNLFGEAASNVVTALLGFITTTSDPVFSGGWWSSSGESVFVKVLAVSGSMMAIAFMLSVITSMLASDHTILTKALIRLPIAAIEMALLTTVTAALLSATDEVATYIAGGTSNGLSEFVGAGMVAAIVDTSVVGLVIGGLVILAGLAVWAQLLIRTALLYCAVMAGPLIFAAAVHPSASGLRKRYIEFGLSIILSKLVVALAFATAAAMVGGVTSSASFAQAVGALLEALAILLIACFAPFILLRLIMGAEAIVAAEGLERRPLRSATSGAQAAYYARGLSSTFKQMGGGAKASAEDGGGTAGGGGGATPPGNSGPSPSKGGPSPNGSPSKAGDNGGATDAQHLPSSAGGGINATTSGGPNVQSMPLSKERAGGSESNGSSLTTAGASSDAGSTGTATEADGLSPVTAEASTAGGALSRSGNDGSPSTQMGDQQGGERPSSPPIAASVTGARSSTQSTMGTNQPGSVPMGDAPAPALAVPNAPPPPRRQPNRQAPGSQTNGPSTPAAGSMSGNNGSLPTGNVLTGLPTNRRPDANQ